MNLFICGTSYTVKDKNQTYPHWQEILASHLKVDNIVWLGKLGCANDMIHSQVEYALEHSSDEDLIIVWLANSANISYIRGHVTEKSMMLNLDYEQLSGQRPPHWQSITGSTIDKYIAFKRNICSCPPGNAPSAVNNILPYVYSEISFYRDQQTLRSMLYLAKNKKERLFFIPAHFYNDQPEKPEDYDISSKNWLPLTHDELLLHTQKFKKTVHQTANHMDADGHEWLSSVIINHLTSH